MQDEPLTLAQRVANLEKEVAELRAAMRYPDTPSAKVVVLRWLENHPYVNARELSRADPGLSYDNYRQAIRMLYREGVLTRTGQGVYVKFLR